MSKKDYSVDEYNKDSRLKVKRMAKVMAFFLLLLITFTLLQVIWLQIFHNYHGVNLKERSRLMFENRNIDKASRGTITDAQGNELAININTYNMYAILNPDYKTLKGEPFYVEDKEKTANELLQVLGLENNQQARDLFISQLNQDASQVEFGAYGKNLTIDQKNAIQALNLPGIKFTEVPTRYYPYGDFASYAVGYAKNDDQGVMRGELGMEQTLDGYLRGQDGESVRNLDAHGIPINQDKPLVITPKANGNNVELTIDANIQAIIQEEMQRNLKDHQFEMAFTIISDIKNGEILGMYSLPTFNPNVRDVKEYQNPFTEYCFEPGSTIKTFLIADAMQRGVWDPNNKTKTGKTTRDNWGGHYIGDWVYNKHKASWGELEWNKGFYVSSNTVMLDILDKVGYDNWINSLTNVWEFGKPVETQFLKTSACDVSPQQPLDKATTAFGQGMTSNAFQILRAYSAIGNGGVMTTPHLVKKIEEEHTGELIFDSEKTETLPTKQAIPPEIAASVLNEMRQAVTYKEPQPYRIGTGYILDNSPVPIAAKTGTSQVAKGGVYSKEGGYISSYAILAPADNPQICMYSVIVNSKDKDMQFYGDMLKNITTKSINYLTKHSNGFEISQDPNQYKVENYVGSDINTARTNLNNQQIKTIVLGSGNIESQYPNPDQVISNDQSIILRGSGDVDINILKGKSIFDGQNIAKLMGWNLEINGVGTINNVTLNENGIIVCECSFPNKVNEEINKRRNA